jgi:hypothetical protein
MQADSQRQGKDRKRGPCRAPRSRAEPFERERNRDAGQQNAKARSRIEQAEQEGGALRVALRHARREHTARHEGEATAESGQHSGGVERYGVTEQGAEHKRHDAGPCTGHHDAICARRRDCPRGDQSAEQIAGGIGGVHPARIRIGPAKIGAHVGQDRRIGKTCDAEADCRRERQRRNNCNIAAGVLRFRLGRAVGAAPRELG